MNIEPEYLTPKSLEDFKNAIMEQDGEQATREYQKWGLTIDDVAKTREGYYADRRMQALTILQMRFEDKRN